MVRTRPAPPDTGLVIADDCTLPLDTATDTFAILAKRGRGKTYTAMVLAEELVDAGVPVCVLDPTGVWWGLRSSADGTAPGLPVVIFGGEHADVPLDETAGALIAEVVIEGRFPAVLDLSLLSKSATRRFATEFLETLYRRNRNALHVLIDEADMFAPQRAYQGVERLLGAMEDVVRRGRARGLGVTLISQRSAALNKTVLSQLDSLFVLGMRAPNDIAAIDDWVSQHDVEDAAPAVKASLPSLPVGTGWLWAPERDLMQRVRVRRRRTFDSSATPKVGESRIEPQRWATVDVAALGERVAALTARAEDDDPKRLRARIRELEKQVAKTAAATRGRTVEVEVPVLADGQVAELARMVDDLRTAAGAITEAARGISDALSRTRPSPPRRETAATPAPAAPLRLVDPPALPGGDAALGRAERRILAVLAQHGRRSTVQVAMLTGYSHKSGGFRNALSSLRTAGYITRDGNGEVDVTGAGFAALGGDYEMLPSGPALLHWWYGQLGKAERLILAEVVAAWPDPLSVEDIARRTGYSATSGGFRNAMSRLRTLQLAQGTRELRAADVLGDARA
jgi:hypothetical protein